jgi:hypothetical protein
MEECTMNEDQMPRRQFLRIGAAALAMIPIIIVPARANAATNAATRASFKYQAKPEGDKSCATCAQFVPPGGCKIMPGDTEISPQGYCIGWTKKA